MKQYNNVRSSERPADVEVKETLVFVAQDVHIVTIEDEMFEEARTEYEYTLLEYTKDEYIFKLHEEQETQNEVLDFLLMGGM